MSPPVVYRPARPDDLMACTQIWSAGIEDYVRRLNQPWFSGDQEPLRRLLAHFLNTDPTRFWVATKRGDRGPVVGFGSATMRGGSWFLGMLFVLPGWQARGVGRQLLEHVLPPEAKRADVALGTATDSVQPISNALYSQYGMVPRLPVFNLVGLPHRPGALPGLPGGVRIHETTWPNTTMGADPTDATDATDATDEEARGIAAIDTATLGHAHPQDHAFLAAEGRRRFIASSERGGMLGYGYIAPSGRFGPLAALDAALLAPIAAQLITTVRAPGAYATWIPGDADDLLVMLLRAGFRFEAFPALLLWNRPVADLTRYVPINLALL